jgi:hypothetical protein
MLRTLAIFVGTLLAMIAFVVLVCGGLIGLTHLSMQRGDMVAPKRDAVQRGDMVAPKRDAARMQAGGPLTNACKTYYTRHHAWPQDLRDLLRADAKGPQILEDADALRDPWGGQYRYDPAGPMNGGRCPDIWAVDPKDGTKVGNWP